MPLARRPVVSVLLASVQQSSVAQSYSFKAVVTQLTTPGSFKSPVRNPGILPLVRDAAMLLEAGKLEEAETVARRAVAAQPRNTAARSVLGAILDQRGLAKEAEAQYREALRLDANSTVALTNLGVLLVRNGRVDEAVTTFERVLRLQPGHAQATFNLGALYIARKDYASRDSAAGARGRDWRWRRQTVSRRQRRRAYPDACKCVRACGS